MYKLIDSASFFPEDEPTLTILNPENVKGLIKKAAHSDIQKFVDEIKPHKDKIYVHILAMGASEYYGANKNADTFFEDALIEYHNTFVTSPAHIFRAHINKNPDIAMGQVIHSVYNKRMHRVELIAWINKELGRDIDQKLNQGLYPSTSMAAKVPFDVCSICGNKARSRREYCLHLRTQLGQMLSDGRKVSAINPGPIKFFDLSIVIKPADVTSSILQKVAFAETISSVELAEEAQITDEVIKQSSHQKFSEFIKTIEDGSIVAASPHLSHILNKTKDPDFELIEKMQHVPLTSVFKGLANLGISPSLTFLAELISRKVLGDIGRNMGAVVEELIHTVGVNNIDIPKVEFDQEDEPSPLLEKELSKYAEDCSLFPEYIEKRASGVGYANLGITHVQPTDQELMAQQHHENAEEHKGLFQTLLGIGGITLLAKWYITNLMQQRLNRPQNQNSAKIVLLKKASDLEATHKLCQASMEHIMIIQPIKPMPDPSMKDSSKAIGFGLFKRFLSRSPSPQIRSLSKVVKTIDLVGSLNQKDK